MIEKSITNTKLIYRSNLTCDQNDLYEYMIKIFPYKSLADSIIFTTIVRVNDFIKMVINWNLNLPDSIHLLLEQLREINVNNDIYIVLD